MSKLDVTSFALAWSVLTEKQRKSLLSQLDSFLSVNSKRAPEFSSYPKSSHSGLNVSKKRSSKKKKKKHQQIPEVKSGSIGGPLERSVFPTTTGSHHSPAKVGSDGVALYGRTLISAKALETLRKKAHEQVAVRPISPTLEQMVVAPAGSSRRSKTGFPRV